GNDAFKFSFKIFEIFFKQSQTGCIFMAAKLFNMSRTVFQGIVNIEAANGTCRCCQFFTAFCKDQSWSVIGFRQTGSYYANDSFVPVLLIYHSGFSILFLVFNYLL